MLCPIILACGGTTKRLLCIPIVFERGRRDLHSLQAPRSFDAAGGIHHIRKIRGAPRHTHPPTNPQTKSLIHTCINVPFLSECLLSEGSVEATYSFFTKRQSGGLREIVVCGLIWIVDFC